MPAPPLKTEISDTYPNPSNAVARVGFAKFYEYVVGLLGSTGNAAEARTALGVPAANDAALTGNPTATTQANSDNSTRIATTAWVRSAMATIASAAGFSSSFGASSYVKFPSWLGGLVVQWGSTVVITDGSGNAAVTFPLTYPTAVRGTVAVSGDSAVVSGAALLSMYTTGWPTTSGFAVHVCNSTNAVSTASASVRVNWISLGN
ncbi:MAG: hypothetical protein JSR41_24675 [Proteobacteria bacterium]|nr:hypothetical protein [Pseudomonadota bacterium]